jgi:hypothetical protein
MYINVIYMAIAQPKIFQFVWEKRNSSTRISRAPLTIIVNILANFLVVSIHLVASFSFTISPLPKIHHINHCTPSITKRGLMKFWIYLLLFF